MNSCCQQKQASETFSTQSTTILRDTGVGTCPHCTERLAWHFDSTYLTQGCRASATSHVFQSIVSSIWVDNNRIWPRWCIVPVFHKIVHEECKQNHCRSLYLFNSLEKGPIYRGIQAKIAGYNKTCKLMELTRAINTILLQSVKWYSIDTNNDGNVIVVVTNKLVK